jgi:magnesium chelatase accessory protein
MASYLFSPLAKLLVGIPLVPWLFARRSADRAIVEQMITATGSTIEPVGIELYARLARKPGHVAGALGMMANWDLGPLERDLCKLARPLVLVTGNNDRTVSPATALMVRAVLPSAKLVSLPGLGHLAHEERPEEVAALVKRLARPARRRRQS